jgi:DNA-directed RNA polymerase specialized sigma24 family protein
MVRSSTARFETFFDTERARLFGTLCLVTGDAEAEELMQEAFVRVWERWDPVGSARRRLRVRRHPPGSGEAHGTIVPCRFTPTKYRRREDEP